MSAQEPLFILGSGAIGFPLAAFLAQAGRPALAVRTSRGDVPRGTITVTIHGAAGAFQTPIETVSLAQLPRLDGTLVLAAKAYANPAIAQALRERGARGPIVILQNGVGVERPFLEADFPAVYRCVLYITSQSISVTEFSVRPVNPSPIGVIRGDADELQRCVDALNTAGFPFRAEPNIQREIWKKAIANAVFNSICPLLDVDNGIFARDAAVAELARAVVSECVELTNRLGLGLAESEVIEQILLISRRSDGQLISTLQDLRAGRETEIASLNLEIARIGAELEPGLALPRVALLGQLIAAKSALRRG